MLSCLYFASLYSVFLCLIYIFLSYFLAKSKFSLYLCVVNELAMTYQTTIVQQRNFNFFGFFSALYLVVSDILLTHTQAQLTSKPTFFVLSYARVRRVVTLVNKGLLGVSFVRCFVSISRYFKNQNKERLTTRFALIEIYKSLLKVLLLTSQEGTINLMPTC